MIGKIYLNFRLSFTKDLCSIQYSFRLRVVIRIGEIDIQSKFLVFKRGNKSNGVVSKTYTVRRIIF